MNKFIEYVANNHDDCATEFLDRDVFNKEVWELRYCRNHEYKYKLLIPEPSRKDKQDGLEAVHE